jgi:hypothetical protein
MKCSQCPQIVDADSPDADGWLRLTLDCREAGIPIRPNAPIEVRTKQLAQEWACSIGCWIHLVDEWTTGARLEEAERELLGDDRPPSAPNRARLWHPGG